MRVIKCPCCVSGLIFPRRNKKRQLKRLVKRLRKTFKKELS